MTKRSDGKAPPTEQWARRRRILRKAESAFDDPGTADALAREGVFLRNRKQMTGPEFLAMLEDTPDDDRPSVTITCYRADTSATREEVEDSLATLLESSAMGEWIGGGQGSIGDRDFFDVTFVVTDLATAIPAVLDQLRRLQVGDQTTVEASDGTTHTLR